MSSAGLCAICDQPDVDFTCDRCGQLVCEDHFDTSTGYCVECAAEVGRGRGGEGDGSGDDDYPDGVGEYRF